tara:strand:+ start:634 stop:1032 length:399 start_codon:yes stop_codon:yes gene_type:complete
MEQNRKIVRFSLSPKNILSLPTPYLDKELEQFSKKSTKKVRFSLPLKKILSLPTPFLDKELEQIPKNLNLVLTNNTQNISKNSIKSSIREEKTKILLYTNELFPSGSNPKPLKKPPSILQRIKHSKKRKVKD